MEKRDDGLIITICHLHGWDYIENDGGMIPIFQSVKGQELAYI